MEDTHYSRYLALVTEIVVWQHLRYKVIHINIFLSIPSGRPPLTWYTPLPSSTTTSPPQDNRIKWRVNQDNKEVRKTNFRPREGYRRRQGGNNGTRRGIIGVREPMVEEGGGGGGGMATTFLSTLTLFPLVLPLPILLHFTLTSLYGV